MISTKTTMKLLAIVVICMAVLLAGCTVPEVVTNPDGTKKTVQVLDPKLSGTLNTIGTIGGAVPQPWGWIIGAATAAIGAVGTGVANYKNKRDLNTTKTAAAKWEDVATTIIQGVEAAGDAAAAVKKSIEERSKTDGNQLVVHDVVQRELS